MQAVAEHFGYTGPDWVYSLAVKHGGYTGSKAEARMQGVRHEPCRCPGCQSPDGFGRRILRMFKRGGDAR